MEIMSLKVVKNVFKIRFEVSSFSDKSNALKLCVIN